MASAPYEPTETVFAFSNDVTAPPKLDPQDPARFLLVGTYAYFDASQDQNSLSDNDLAKLQHEIEINDWIVLEWIDLRTVEKGQKFTAVILHNNEKNIYRTQDPSPPASIAPTSGFATRIRFRRKTLSPMATYNCPANAPPFVCTNYQPLGSRITLQTTLDEVAFNDRDTVSISITVSVKKRKGDPEDTQQITLTDKLNATNVSERIAETNLDLMNLYTQFDLRP